MTTLPPRQPNDAGAEPAAGFAVLVVMLKAPHRAKSRLLAQIGPEATAAAHHLAACALEDAREWPGPVCLASAASEDLHWAQAHRCPAWMMLTQSAGSLGARINHIDRELRSRGHQRQLFIGTDCPQLDRGYLTAADAALAGADAALGAARDGGVVLMASRRRWPDLSGLPWSTPALGAALAALLSDRGWTVTWLDERIDVDDEHSLRQMREALGTDPRPARRRLHDWLASSMQALPS